jgi:hypothetical protein
MNIQDIPPEETAEKDPLFFAWWNPESKKIHGSANMELRSRLFASIVTVSRSWTAAFDERKCSGKSNLCLFLVYRAIQRHAYRSISFLFHVCPMQLVQGSSCRPCQYVRKLISCESHDVFHWWQGFTLENYSICSVGRIAHVRPAKTWSTAMLNLRAIFFCESG